MMKNWSTANMDKQVNFDTLPDNICLYYSEEGFGAIYRRFMLNIFFAEMIRQTNIRKVGEVPLDSYGVIGAGSLIFTQLDCTVTLISDGEDILDRAKALMEFNQVSGVEYIHSSLYDINLPDDRFDFTWSFDRFQTLSDKKRFLQELCRISKATMISVPNAYNYGQYLHHFYHIIQGTTCEYVGPRKWMRRATLRDSLEGIGMEIVTDGIIDAPWWPGFPELPNLIRNLIGRESVSVDKDDKPEVNPRFIPPNEVSSLKKRVERSAFFERCRLWPMFIKVLFSHNVYVVGCKPKYRNQLGI
jgi:hypothetical protein